jgi:drug/metabolite transporter (DMT)-like permease
MSTATARREEGGGGARLRRAGVEPAVLAAIIVTTLLWASAFVAIRSVREHFAPGPLALGRLLVGAAALSALMAFQRAPLPSRRDLAPIIACGVLWFALYNVLLNASERLIDAGTAAMLVNVAPVMIALGAALVLRERLSAPLLGGLGIALAGAIVIGWSSGHHHGGAGGATLCVLAGAAYTAAVLIQKPLLARVAPVTLTWAACLAGALALAPFAPSLVHDASRAPGGATLLVAYLGGGPTAVAFTTWAFALSRSTMARQGATTYLVPPLVIALSWVSLGEVPGAVAMLGGAACLAGVALTRRRR